MHKYKMQAKDRQVETGRQTNKANSIDRSLILGSLRPTMADLNHSGTRLVPCSIPQYAGLTLI